MAGRPSSVHADKPAAALKSLQIIPRTPSPEQRSPEDMCRDELLRLVRQLEVSSVEYPVARD